MSTPKPRRINFNSQGGHDLLVYFDDNMGYLGNGSTGLTIVGDKNDAVAVNFKNYYGQNTHSNEPIPGNEVFFICDNNDPNNYVGNDPGGNGLVLGKAFSQATMFLWGSDGTRIFTPDNQYAIVNLANVGLALGAPKDAVIIPR